MKPRSIEISELSNVPPSGVRKVAIGIIDFWCPSVCSDVAFDPSMSALLIIAKQYSQSLDCSPIGRKLERDYNPVWSIGGLGGRARTTGGHDAVAQERRICFCIRTSVARLTRNCLCTGA